MVRAVRARVHRGSHEIGGNCVEVAASDGQTVILDMGRPLSAGWDDPVTLPPIAGLTDPDPSLLGLLISHPHLDHYGLAGSVPAEVPTYIGREAAAILDAAAFFSPVSGRIDPAGHFQHRRPLRLGPFTVTPYLNDHSAFDAYSLLVEAGGRRLFYTGDIRGHGRKAALFDQLLADPPHDVDVLLMEGTHVRADATHDDATFETESQLEDRFVDLCNTSRGAVVVFGSAQNLDRLVTVYRAARRADRQLVVDLYGASVAAATRATIPQPGFPDFRVYVPNRQRIRVKETGAFHRTAQVRPMRVFPEELAAYPERFILHVPSSTARELIGNDVLNSAGMAIWSLWDGYLSERSGIALTDLLAQQAIPLVHVHTSGHASVADLRRLVAALDPKRVVPIHSEAGDRFAELFPRVEAHSDGVWWEV
jgi:ribonuclease J